MMIVEKIMIVLLLYYWIIIIIIITKICIHIFVTSSLDYVLIFWGGNKGWKMHDHNFFRSRLSWIMARKLDIQCIPRTNTHTKYPSQSCMHYLIVNFILLISSSNDLVQVTQNFTYYNLLFEMKNWRRPPYVLFNN